VLGLNDTTPIFFHNNNGIAFLEIMQYRFSKSI